MEASSHFNNWDILYTTLQDGGPLYTETDLSRWVAEPFNAVSAFPFLLLALYWGYLLRKNYSHYPMLTLCVALIGIGGVGGTLYHAFRSSRIFYLMDVVPISAVAALLGGFLWWRLFKRKDRKLVLVALLPFAVAEMLASNLLHGQMQVNATYCVQALIILTPILLMLRKTRYKHGQYVAYAVAFFVVGLFFRVIDAHPKTPEWFSMGTHWLWHSFTAVASYFLLTYFYQFMASLHMKDPHLHEIHSEDDDDSKRSIG
jgi:hemolysin III